MNISVAPLKLKLSKTAITGVSSPNVTSSVYVAKVELLEFTDPSKYTYDYNESNLDGLLLMTGTTSPLECWLTL